MPNSIAKEGNLNICVVMPALNEHGSIDKVVSEVNRYLPDAKILIVDDGSQIPIKLRSANSTVRIIRSEKNLGVGSALYIGLKIALISNFEVIITMDSDGQHNADDLNSLLKNRLRFDLIVGSRNMSTYPWSKTRLFAHRLLKRMLCYKFDLNLNDPTSGFRLFNRKAAKMALLEIGDNYLEDTAVLYARLCSRDIEIGEVECDFNPRQFGKPSHQGAILAVKYIASVLSLLLLRDNRK